jgi:hypothetical protein
MTSIHSVLIAQMTLQVFQCGLTWRIVLTKSKDIAAAFHHFDVDSVAAMTSSDVERLMNNGTVAGLFVCSSCLARISNARLGFLRSRQDYPKPRETACDNQQRQGNPAFGQRNT